MLTRVNIGIFANAQREVVKYVKAPTTSDTHSHSRPNPSKESVHVSQKNKTALWSGLACTLDFIRIQKFQNLINLSLDSGKTYGVAVSRGTLFTRRKRRTIRVRRLSVERWTTVIAIVAKCRAIRTEAITTFHCTSFTWEEWHLAWLTTFATHGIVQFTRRWATSTSTVPCATIVGLSVV